jgi:hypothetical protein
MVGGQAVRRERRSMEPQWDGQGLIKRPQRRKGQGKIKVRARIRSRAKTRIKLRIKCRYR